MLLGLCVCVWTLSAMCGSKKDCVLVCVLKVDDGSGKNRKANKILRVCITKGGEKSFLV